MKNKKMKNREGFTLIELLAIIALLAILVILTVPNILKTFNEVQKKAFVLDVRSYVKAAQQGYESKLMSGDDLTETVLTYNNGNEQRTGNIPVDYTGRKPESGSIRVTTEGDIEAAIHNGKYCAIKNLTSDEIEISELPAEECGLAISLEPTPDECFVINLGEAPSGHGGSNMDLDGVVIHYYNYDNPVCSKNVVIPREINGVAVEGIGDKSFSQYDPWSSSYVNVMKIESVYIPNTVQYVGYDAFNTNQITSLTFENNGQLTDIVWGAFDNNNITSLVLPESSEQINIDSVAFRNNNFNSVYISSSVYSINSQAFYESGINSLTFAPGSQINYIAEEAFYGTNFTSVNIPNGIDLISFKAFAYANLREVTIGNTIWGIASDAFEGNAALESIYINRTSGFVTTMNGYSDKWGATNATIYCAGYISC